MDGWRKDFLSAVGERGQIVVDIVPELELIIGQQPAVASLPPVESRNRFQTVFHDFLQVFSRRKIPVVIFLDDLQWASSASLNLKPGRSGRSS